MELIGDNIILSRDRTKNYITYKGFDFRLTYLSNTFRGNKGGNSNVFTLFDPSRVIGDRIIKICRAPLASTRPKDINRLKRFEREIESLKMTKSKNFIIEYYFDDTILIAQKEFRYYVMEKGDTDLKEHICNNILTIDDKISLCRQVLNSIVELHELGIYHRDIKPDNFFFIGNVWKIGDLGLIAYRHEDNSIDNPNEFVGPRGWVSPETMNKFLTFQKSMEYEFDCDIDNYSDVFQLGNLFWFIFQGNVPIGKIQRKDFLLGNDSIFAMLMWMINHSKNKRPDIKLLEREFTNIVKKIAA
ncbi:MAG: protein kinase [Ignavibacteria bacterium]|nr:protein kinase [Ignavibacteria bacterium]